MALTTTNPKVAQCVAALRRCIGNGTNLTGDERALMLDTLLALTQSDVAFTDIAEDDFVDGRAT